MQEFDTKVVGIMTYFLHRLGAGTYWSPDMMRLLVFMADTRAKESVPPRSLSGLQWEASSGAGEPEALGYEGVRHWERYISFPTLWERLRASLFPSSFWGEFGITQEDLKILEEVAAIKQSDDYKIGSFAFRHYVLTTCTLPPRHSLLPGEDRYTTFPLPPSRKEELKDEEALAG